VWLAPAACLQSPRSAHGAQSCQQTGRQSSQDQALAQHQPAAGSGFLQPDCCCWRCCHLWAGWCM
jgi:hypothetical protein